MAFSKFIKWRKDKLTSPVQAPKLEHKKENPANAGFSFLRCSIEPLIPFLTFLDSLVIEWFRDFAIVIFEARTEAVRTDS